MQRRRFIKNSTTLLGALGLHQFDLFNAANPLLLMKEDVTTIQVGKMKCTIFRDVLFKYLAKDFFINADPNELTTALNQYNIADGNIPSPFIAVLVQHENRKVLIDTGVGFTEKPINVRGKMVSLTGKLYQLLRQENIQPSDITDVVITHLHPDHIGGITDEHNQVHFPNAQFHIHEDEWNYWHTSASGNQPDQFKFFIEKNVTGLKNHHLNLVKGDFTQLLPGITAVKAEGHTPGQMALILHSDKEHLLYISDAFLHPLHIEKLDWQTNYDLDYAKAKQSRIKLLELARKEDMLINAFHFDFPGLGRVERKGKDWKWQYSKNNRI